MADTAVADPDTGTPLGELAARHGLTVASARPRLVPYTRKLWSYRHFISSYANARVQSSFSTTRLGRLWQVLTPLTNAAVYYLIFGVILNTRNGVENFIPYLCTGVFIFTYTQTVAHSGVQAIAGNLGLIRALHFPRASLPIAITLVQLQNMFASMAVLVVIVLAFGEPLTVEWLLAVPALLLQTLFNVGLALALARVGSKLPDFKQLLPFITRTWLYGSGVLYSVAVFSKHLPPLAATIVELNPLLVYIELMRHALMEDAPLTSDAPRLWLLGTAWAVLAAVGGFLYFWRGEQEYGRG